MTDLPPSGYRCSGCGAAVDEDAALPFRCPAVSAVPAGGDDIDHILEREPAPMVAAAERALVVGGADDAEAAEPNPFLRYRTLLHAWHFARARGLADEDFAGLVRSLDGAVAAAGGSGFVETPCESSDSLSEALGFAAGGGVIAKDESGNVAGSHKARHLFGVLLYLAVRERLGLGPERERPLAIASCGNAALAAAVLARAAERRLEVFVPAEADGAVVGRLEELGANVTVCEREEGVPGDPSVRRFRAAVAAGALPFTCQGPENGLVIEGGQTLGYEMVSHLGREGLVLDRLFVQVGGGALASACIAAFREARDAGVLDMLPRIHPVQTAGGHPLVRAWERLTERMLARFESGEEEPADVLVDRERASLHLRERIRSTAAREELEWAAAHRSEFMWPWEEPPSSIAAGILDDETYDWRAVVRGTLESGGYPVVVGNEEIREACELVAASRPAEAAPVCFTGCAGFAGLARLRATGAVAPEETVGVLLTGARR